MYYNQERAQELLVGFVDHLDTAEREEVNGLGNYDNTGKITDLNKNWNAAPMWSLREK